MKKLMIFVFGLASLLFAFSSCHNFDPEPDPGVCDHKVVVDAELYKKGTSSHFTLSNVKIEGDCLSFSITSSGCSGDTWKIKLVDSGAIAESFPEQRWARVILTNEELCDAVISKEVSFDLTPLRTGSGKLTLHLKDWDEALLYTY